MNFITDIWRRAYIMANQSSEYGGDPGLIQSQDKGHQIGPGSADRRGVQEQAMLLRMHGAREKAGLPALSDQELRDLLGTADWKGQT